MLRALIPALLVLAVDAVALGQVVANEKPALAKPGIGAWSEYRGDPLNTGVSYSRRPAYKGTKWKYFAGSPLTSTPAVAQGLVIAPSEGGFVNAIDAETGNRAWIRQCGSGALGQGIVFFFKDTPANGIYTGSKTGRIYCLDLKSGNILFESEPAKKEVYSSPKGDRRGIVFGSIDNTVHCIDPETGRHKWRVATHREVGATPAIVGDMVYVPCKDRYIYEIVYETGEVRRKLEMPSTSNSTPVIGLGFAFVMTSASKLVATDLFSGKVEWEAETTGDDQVTSALADGVLYVPVGAQLRAINAVTGEKLWQIECGHKVCPPIVNGDDVLFTARDRKFRVANRKTGEVTFSLDFEDGFVAGPVLVDGTVFVATDVNSGVHVHAIE